MSQVLGRAGVVLLAVLAGCGGGGDNKTPPASDAEGDADSFVEVGAASVVVTPTTGLVTTEKGGSATFTIALTAPPSGDVTIALSTSNDKEGAVSPASVTFTPMNWNAPQTVTVTGVDDAAADGAQSYTIVTAPAVSSDPSYSGLDPADVEVSNTDDESAGVTVTPTGGLTTSEAGGTATFTLVLNTKPTADVEIPLSTSNEKEGVPGVTLVKFTPLDWDAPKTVTVTGVDDADADGAKAYEIRTGAAKSADSKYEGLDAADVKLTNTDDESAGVTVKPTTGLKTTEAGGSASFTIVLNSRPEADVYIPLASSNTKEGVVSVAKVKFTAFDYNAPQVVTVTGVDDALADGNQPYLVVTEKVISADARYNGLEVDDVNVTNVDDETAGITVKPTTGLVTTESGGRATFSIVLNSQPTADVTIPLSSNDAAEGTVSPTSVKFTTANWNAPQEITVTGVDDAIADGSRVYRIVTAAASSADKSYDGINADDVEVTNTDNDSAGVTVSPTSGLYTSEAGISMIFTVVLNTKPTADVTLPLSSSNALEGKVSPASLTFTALNWNAPQEVTVTGVNGDDIADGDQPYKILTGALVSADKAYHGLDPDDVSAVNIDNDRAGVSVMLTSDPMTTEAGGTASLRVVLNSQPLADVTFPIATSNAKEGTASVASVTFTKDNWNAPKTITVTGVDDKIADGNQPYFLRIGASTSTDARYNGMDPPDVELRNVDNDSAGFIVTPTSGLVTTEGGGSATFTVALTSEPLADVVIGLASSNAAEGAASPASLTFTKDNWNAPQTVTVTGKDDFVADGNQVYSIVTAAAVSTDMTYSGMNPADVDVRNTDNDSAGIRVTYAGGGLTVNEGSGTATFSVRLESEPTADVTIPLTVSDTTEGKISHTSLKFTKLDWAAPQTVTVTGLNDDVADGDQVFTIVTEAAVSVDPGYSGRTAPDVPVTNTDNDSAGITVSAASGDTTEAGGTATFTIVLNSEPTGNVRIDLSSNDATEGEVSPAYVEFTAANWNAPQTVTVTGKDDFVADGAQPYKILTAKAISTDAQYAAIDPGDVSLANTDNDSAGVTVSAVSGATTEAGGTATFTIKLNSQPTADVRIDYDTDDATEGTVASKSVTFTADNWNAPQTITVTGKDDAVADGNQTYRIVTANAVSDDPGYSGRTVADVELSNTDNDKAGIVVSAISGATTEGGAKATFTVVLTSEPTADVSIDVRSDDLTEGDVSTGTLSFTKLNWNAPQTVTVTGKDDLVADGNQPYKVLLAAAVSADPGYHGVDPTDVAVSNTDNDSAGVTVSAISGTVSEKGTTATFTIKLDSQPVSDVTIYLSSSDTTEGVVAPDRVTFTPSDYGPKVVTVTGMDDAMADGDQPFKIVTSAPTTTDSAYRPIVVSDVDVTNVDDDTAGFIVSAISGPTTEMGGKASFTVRLRSMPTGDVTIPVSVSDPTEGTASTSSLVFVAGYWNVAQTVTVTGKDDAIADGNQPYKVVLGTTSSSDANYNAKDPPDVELTNTDNDLASIVLTAAAGLQTTEAGGTATFTIALTSEPTADVTIYLTSSDLTEGTVPASVTFTPTEWSTKTVTITGADDSDFDGDVAYTIVTSNSVSTDPSYSGIVVADVAVTNRENDFVSKKVFITSTIYGGDLGGVAGADAKCASHALSAGLSGTFKAWISTTGAAASTRLVNHPGAYVRVDGVTVANSWTDLTDGTLAAPINVTEKGEPATASTACGVASAWTNTTASGGLAAPYWDSRFSCRDWTTTSYSTWGPSSWRNTGWAGAADMTTSAWTTSCNAQCNQTAAIYCFEQ